MPEERAMAIRDLHPELRETYSKFPFPSLERGWVRWLLQLMLRFRNSSGRDTAVRLTTERFAMASARIYEPQGPLRGAGLLWIHGGGMIMGEAKMNDAQCIRYAKEMGLVVVSVDYRLAPKHRYPAAIDDCNEVWQWFVANAGRLGVDHERIAVSGQSAGGGLAAALCQRILDEGGPQPIAQMLFYPMLDDKTAARRELDIINHLGWNNSNNRFGWSAYLGAPAGSKDEPPPWSVPGRRNDLKGLPPAWIGVGDLDIFREESKSYANRLIEAEVPCELVQVEGAPHGFDALVPQASVSQTFRVASDDFLNKITGARCDGRI